MGSTWPNQAASALFWAERAKKGNAQDSRSAAARRAQRRPASGGWSGARRVRITRIATAQREKRFGKAKVPSEQEKPWQARSSLGGGCPLIRGVWLLRPPAH